MDWGPEGLVVDQHNEDGSNDTYTSVSPSPILFVPFACNIKGWREGDEDEVITKDIGNDFIEQWVVARANVAERVVVGV